MRLVAAALFLLMATAAPAQKPSLPSGVSRLTPHAFAYRPPGLADGAPLVVLFHGAGGNARRFLDLFKPVADRRRLVLVALQSGAATWDTMPSIRTGSDSAKLATAVARLAATAAVDSRRLVLLGFSDGASHALTLGLANPAAFRGIVALSPGFARAPDAIEPAQRIFIAHGRRDEVLPFALSRDVLVPGLERLGLRPRTRWSDGGHRIEAAAVEEGLGHALADPPR